MQLVWLLMWRQNANEINEKYFGRTRLALRVRCPFANIAAGARWNV
jgi:hypothetical protein